MFCAREHEEKSHIYYVPHHRSCDHDLSVRHIRSSCVLRAAKLLTQGFPSSSVTHRTHKVTPACNEIQRRQNLLRVTQEFIVQNIVLGAPFRGPFHFNLLRVSIYLSGLVTAVAVFRNPNNIPFCLTTDMLLNVLFSWLLVHLPSTFFLDVLFFFFPLVSTP